MLVAPVLQTQKKKKGNSRYFANANVPYHIYKEIVKLSGVVFKSKPLKIEDRKLNRIRSNP